jgi:hypothetical protein
MLGGIFETADDRVVYDIACYADGEQIAETLVENEFGRHPRVGAREDRRDRMLRGH